MARLKASHKKVIELLSTPRQFLDSHYSYKQAAIYLASHSINRPRFELVRQSTLEEMVRLGLLSIQVRNNRNGYWPTPAGLEAIAKPRKGKP